CGDPWLCVSSPTRRSSDLGVTRPCVGVSIDINSNMFYLIYLTHDNKVVEPVRHSRKGHTLGTERRREDLYAVLVDVLFSAVFHEDRKSTRLNSSHVSISYA